MRRLLALVFAVGGPLLLLARRRRSAGPRVRLHYADGSLLELEPGRPDADRLVAVARRAL